jgi:hypothetical protein
MPASNAPSKAPGNGAPPPPSSVAADPNAAARQSAQTISDDDLVQRAGTLYATFIAYPPTAPWCSSSLVPPIRRPRETWRVWPSTGCVKKRQEDPSCNIYIPEVFKIFTKGGPALHHHAACRSYTSRAVRQEILPSHFGTRIRLPTTA